MKNKALEYLSKDELLNFDMIQQLNKPECRVIYAEDDGVMLTPNERIIMISVDSIERCRELLKTMPRKVFCAHNEYCIEVIRQMYPDIRLPQVCRNAIYSKQTPVPITDNRYSFRPLEKMHEKIVGSVYSTVEKPGYILERINSGCLFGCFDTDGTLLCVGGIHDDGSIGMVHTFEKHRRKGAAEFLSKQLINLEISRGHIPYVQINCENTASTELYKKLGFEFSEKYMYWI
ncbi:MAG: GNAT family N-acetyltransferase [Anaerofustis stercorihominis]|nr:GNAT family N-acetyltransferase [Anaerofustis stercorihominis]